LGEGPSDRTVLRRDAGLTVVGSVASIALAGIAGIVVARELGAVGRGEWAAISSLAILTATVAGLGLPSAASYATATVGASARHRVIRASLLLGAALGGFGALAYVILANLLDTASGTVPIVGGGAIALLSVLQTVAQQIVLTGVSLRWFAVVQLVSAISVLAAVVVFAVAGTLTVEAVVLIYAARLAVSSVVALAVLARRYWRQQPAPGDASGVIATMRPYLGYAIWTFATIALTQLVQRADVLLVQGFLGNREAGLYAVAIQIVELLIVIPGALGFVVFRSGALSNPTHWSDAVRALRWALGVQLVTAALVAAFAPQIISVVFGDEYLGSVDALRLLMPAAVFLGMQSVISNYLAGRGRPRRVVAAWGAGAVIGIGVNAVVIPSYGITGAATVASFAFLVVLILHFEALRSLRQRDRPAQ
jgi:O-antigen/teichoic acid export membrane protein